MVSTLSGNGYDNSGTYSGPPGVILGADGRPLGQRPREEYQDGFALPLQLEFQTLLQSSWKQYWAHKYDESRRVPSPDFHLVMWRQLHLHAMLQERFLALQDLEWELEVDDDRDPFQVAVKDGLTKILQRTPRLYQLLYSMHLAIWPGRSAAQVAWEWETMDLPAVQAQAGVPGVLPATLTTGSAPRRALRVARHAHTNGDKILYKTDHTPMVMVYAPKAPEIPGLLFEPTQTGAFAAELRGTWRNRFLIHQHWCLDADFFEAESQDSIHGTGLRSTLAWSEWMRSEWLGQAVVQLERFGLGTRAWYFDASNPAALGEVKKRAKDQSDRANIFVPFWPNDRRSVPAVENIETPIGGTEVVLRLVEHMEYWQQRLINGSAIVSTHANSGGLGGGDIADANQSQQRNVVRADARMLAESLTGSAREPGLVWLTFSRTYPELVGKMSCPRWKFNVPEEKAGDILAAVETFCGLGGTVRESDALQLLPGFKRPGPDEATLGGQQALAQAQAAQAAGAGPGGEPGGEGEGGEGGQPPAAGPPAIGSKPPGNAGQHYQFAEYAFDESKHPRGQPDNAGEFAPKGSAAKPSKLQEQAAQAVKRITPVKQRAFAGKPVDSKTKLSKQLAGAIGEAVCLQFLQSKGYKDAAPFAAFEESERNNLPADLIHDHRLIEVKAGQASNGAGAQQWRLTIGEPGEKEKAELAAMTPAQKARHNADKQALIKRRKQEAIARAGKRLGFKVGIQTMTVILNPDTRTADVYLFEGVHDRIGWNSEQAKAGYVGSYRYDG